MYLMHIYIHITQKKCHFIVCVYIYILYICNYNIYNIYIFIISCKCRIKNYIVDCFHKYVNKVVLFHYSISVMKCAKKISRFEIEIGSLL